MIKQNILVEAPSKVDVIGVPVSAVTMETALAFVSENFEQIRGEYICAANAHTTVMAHEDESYKKIQEAAILALPDGKPLAVVGCKKTNCPMEKTTGTHFMQSTFTDSRFSGKKHYFYGTRKEDLERMIPQIQKDYPGLSICGWEPSVFRELTDEELEQLALRINEAKADFVWVAIGAPRQERLMYRLKGKVNGVMTGVGGAFHILSGTMNDAPMWMQNAGLEWFYRLCKEPKRLFGRYLVTNTKFVYYVLRECWNV